MEGLTLDCLGESVGLHGGGFVTNGRENLEERDGENREDDLHTAGETFEMTYTGRRVLFWKDCLFRIYGNS